MKPRVVSQMSPHAGSSQSTKIFKVIGSNVCLPTLIIEEYGTKIQKLTLYLCLLVIIQITSCIKEECIFVTFGLS